MRKRMPRRNTVCGQEEIAAVTVYRDYLYGKDYRKVG